MSSNQVRLAQKYNEDKEKRKSFNPVGNSDLNVKWFKAQPNATVRIRILPPFDPDNQLFALAYGMHYVRDLVAEGEPFAHPCPRLTEKKKCPLCEKAFALRKEIKDGNTALESEYMKYRATFRYLMQVVDLTGPESYKEGVQLFACGKGIYEDLITYMCDERNWGDFTNMDHGFAVSITAKGKGIQTRYTTTLDREQSSFHAGFLDLRIPLDDVIIIPTYEELASLIPNGNQALPIGGVPQETFPNPVMEPNASVTSAAPVPSMPEAAPVPDPQMSLPVVDPAPSAEQAPAPDPVAPAPQTAAPVIEPTPQTTQPDPAGQAVPNPEPEGQPKSESALKAFLMGEE